MAVDEVGAAPKLPDQDDERKSEAAAGIGLPDRLAEEPVRIVNFDLARQLLRSGGVRQAGFRAELLEKFAGRTHAPVLFQDGEAHQKQRSATARFFAPKVVATRYRQLMESLSDRLVERFRSAGHAELDVMSLELAVAVAAEIVGLTRSDQRGMSRRLNRFFAASGSQPGWLSAFTGFALGQYRMLAFYLHDVRPAIRVRRAAPREDVISHLIEQGYSNREILTECMTYAAAGMATTREFIVMAAWHLLEREDLRARFLDGNEQIQVAILEEILRLEPVVGALYRRTERELKLDDDGAITTLAAGTLVKIDVRAMNSDPVASGGCPFKLDANREVRASKASASLMSFGDGPHKCPGASVALQETAIFLDRLLRVPNIRLTRPPTIGWNALISSYELRDAQIASQAG
ncbi:cytochrome P450 [Bradyrhizobium japonicum]|uniref:cytochrome P450 n=1 Tax=Bradyrhizobium japonicum TaxID=375 RepID=UPI001BAB06B2|nr:cytochrome P450 [Bradyrhizobium japonicum]MBR0989831.1 cytochrome P450 [Bradyrhizobium japonicum]